MRQRQLHRDHPAERHTGDRCSLHSCGIHDRYDVVGQHRQAIVTIWRIRRAVPARVYPQETEGGQQVWNAGIPQPHVRTDRI
jgi:hypothetical protein